jgi:tetratricopeptide (TPR) repeat protein
MKYDLREPSSAGQAIYHRRSPGGWYLSVKDVVTPDLHNTATGISPFMMCLGGQGPTLEVHDLRRLPSTTAKPLQTYRPQGLPETLHQTRLGMEEEVSVSGLAYSKTRREILVSYQGDQIYGFNTADAAACGEEGETHESWSLGGHVNSKTFLKSVTYFGPREEYIACGDDLAHTWIWDRRTGMLVNLVCTDMSVANGCVPHPFLPMLACWGIDDMVKVLTVGGRFSSIKEEESVDKALEEEEEGGAAAGAGARQESGRERPRRGRGGREERGGGRRRAPRWTVKGLQLLPSQYVGTILEIGMVSRVFSNPEKPRMVYDHERYRQHVRRIRQFLAQPGDRLPDYPTDSSDSYTLAELESMLLEVKERGNVFFKAKQYRRAARSYKKIEIWLFSMAEMRRKVDKARLEASALGDSDHYERWLGDPAGSSLVPPVQQPSRRQAVVAKDVTGTTGKGGGEAKNGTHEEEQDAVLTRLVDLLVTSNLNLAMTVQAQGQHLHAIALCTSVLRIKPREAKAFYRRGVAALELGEDFEAAVKDLARARDLAPGDALIARKLAEGRRLLKAQLARESRAYAAFFLSSAPDEEEGATGGAAGQG